MKSNITLVAVVVSLSAATGFAQQSTSDFDVKPAASILLDADKLKEIDELMTAEVKAGNIVGCIGLVARGGDVGYLKMWGDANREDNRPMTADSIFRIYSMSKPITSVAAMQLVEQGKMKLDEPLSKYLPAFKSMKVMKKDGTEVDAENPITVRDVFRHTTGFTYGFFGNTKVDQAYVRNGILFTQSTIEETVAKLGKLPLLHQPGTRWHYSVSTDVLGRLIEVVSGERFDKYLQKHIFAPLDMKDTGFMVPADKLNRFAEMYRGKAGELKPSPARSSTKFVSADNTYFSGGGGLCSTTRDYLQFATCLLHGGELNGKRIIKKETLDEMTKDQIGHITKGRGAFKFGLGFSIGSEGEFSWGGAAGTRFWVNPKRNLIVIYMIQINPYGNRKYGNQMRQIVRAADKRATDAK